LEKENSPSKISNFTKGKFKIGIFLLDLIVFIAIYILAPGMLNFPANSMNISFQKATIGFSFLQVTVICFLAVIIVQNIILNILSKNVNLYLNEYSHRKEIDYETVKKVRNDCLNIPYKFLIIQWAITFALGFFIATFLMIFGKSFIENFDKILFAIIRFTTIIIAAWLLLTVAILILSQQYFLNILKSTYTQTKEFEKIGHRVDNTRNLLIQVLPMILSLLILFAVTAYVKTIQVKSESLANYYKLYMDEIDFKDGEITKDTLLAKLNTIPIIQNGDAGFVIDPNNNSYTTSYDTNISDFTIAYRDYFFGREEQNKSTVVNFTEVSGMLYESYGVDEHLYCQRIFDSNGLAWYIGFKFSVADESSMQFYILCTIGMFAIYAVIIYIWAKSNSINAKRIAQNMEEILQKDDLSKGNFLPILSNDEIGDISFYYNQIQEKLARQQDIMLKQEQLSVLGEMAGGMAHDINTPISAINTAITMLSKKTADERELAILKNMQVSTDRIISIVTSMRNQVRNMGSDAKETFSLNTMVSDLNVIIQNELKKSGCTFSEDIKEEIFIYGERTKLGQVLTNLVVNGIQAYTSNEKKGNVTLHAETEGKDTCLIEIIDEAGGIPEKVQPYIFNNIMTTKGSKGTGLGLYLASTVIKGVYEGEISFETVVGKGTKFIIRIPMKKEEQK
jgi:signal transduction histidine kinase